MEQGKVAATTLKAFNRCVLHLGRLARERGAAEFIADGLQAFRSTGAVLPRPGGARCLRSVAMLPPQSWMHGASTCPNRLPPNGTQNAGSDRFSHDTLSRPGEVMRDSGFTDPHAQVGGIRTAP